MRKPTMFIKSLKEATTEEAVKAAYVKQFHLKFDNPFGVDLLHPPILFEFKYKKDLENKREHARVMAQALYYAHYIRYQAENIDMPSAICLADCNQAVLHPVDEFIDLIDKKFNWDRPASSPDVNLIKAIIDKDSESVVYPMQDACGVEEFAAALKYIIEDCIIPLKRLITIKNFESVYSLWLDEVAAYIDATDLNFPWAFVQDACESVTMNCKTGTLLFETTAKVVKVAPLAYKRFWNKFERPPNKATQKTLLASVDRLAAMDKRRYEGMFYTPEPFSSLSLEYLEKVLGPDWQDEYYIYDPCCGTGNLEMKLKRYDRLFMSTLEQNEVDYLQQEKIFPGAKIFQFDFLNDPIEKMPKKLRQILKNEKVVILMNPPFGAANAGINKGVNKAGVIKNKYSGREALGKAANELFVQFLWRCEQLCPQAIIGLYSKLKFITAPTFTCFRDLYPKVVNAGFVFHCSCFHGVTGKWPVSFSVLSPGGYINECVYNILNKKGLHVGTKIVKPVINGIHSWFNRFR
ncbi:MAG: N-6 DNA methylase, partial [Candidatus Bathyarchaeia archaeon]